jgi:Universal stress protein family
MGTHGRTGLAHLLRGSVAEEVMRTARCSVLTVKSQNRREPAVASSVPAHPCFVCAAPGAGPICETCAARVTAEARERKLHELRRRV